MFELTIFKSTYDNKTNSQLVLDSWPKFQVLLKQLSCTPGYKPKKGEFKKGSSLISPAIYHEGSSRSNTNVVKWGRWAALDVDTYNGTFAETLDQYKDYEHICYSTASSREEHPKFRVLFPLTRDVAAREIKHFWYAINKHFGEDGDPQTKDLSRMYYVPATYGEGAYNFFIENTGKIIDPDELMEEHPWAERAVSFLDRLPESMRTALIQRRKDELTNTNIHWTTWNTCPFVNKRIVAEYKVINEGGWYHKMYQLMVSIAANAIKKKYPITANEISSICKEIDNETGGWYANRPIEKEAARAIEFVYSNGI